MHVFLAGRSDILSDTIQHGKWPPGSATQMIDKPPATNKPLCGLLGGPNANAMGESGSIASSAMHAHPWTHSYRTSTTRTRQATSE